MERTVDGQKQTFTMNTVGIGKRPPAAEPEEPKDSRDDRGRQETEESDTPAPALQAE